MLVALYPDFMQKKIKNIGIKIIYNAIYFFSACQIKYNQTYNYLLPYFKGEQIINQIKIEEFDINTNKLQTISNHILIIDDTLENKLFIASSGINNDNNLSINKSIISKNNASFLFDASNITFIALYLNYNGMLYNINLKTDEFNYYLVGNVIDKYFIQYYINTVLGLKFSYTESEILTYQLELMDHEVNMIYLNSEQYIIIDKNNYSIINNVKVLEEDIKEDIEEDIKEDDI